MRNIIIIEDRLYYIQEKIRTNESIVSISCDRGADELYILTNVGIVYKFCYEESILISFEIICELQCQEGEEIDYGWFEISFISATGSIVCLSHSGSIVSIPSLRLSLLLLLLLLY